MDFNVKRLSWGEISREELKKHFANDAKLDKLLLIFDRFNAQDGNIDERLSDMDIHSLGRFDRDNDGISSEFEFRKHIEIGRRHNTYTADIDDGDIRKFWGFVASEGNKNYEKALNESAQKLGMDKELVEQLGVGDAENYKRVEENGKTYYIKTFDDGSMVKRDFSGEMIESKLVNTGDDENLTEISRYDEKGAYETTFINNETGETVRENYNDQTRMTIKDNMMFKQRHHKSDDMSWQDLRLEELVFGVNTPDSVNILFDYDENNQFVGLKVQDNNLPEDELPRGFTTDGETFFTHIPKKTIVEDSTIQNLKCMLDGGARFGEDFSLAIEDGKLKIKPKIVNQTADAPELQGAALKKYTELVANGVHAAEDFDVILAEDGSFQFELKNNQARNYSGSYRAEKYDKNGNIISAISVVGDDVVTETFQDGKKRVQKSSLDDLAMQYAIEGKFDYLAKILGEQDILDGGYDIYSLAEKYKAVLGRELAEDVYDSEQAGLSKGTLKSKLVPQYVGIFEDKEEFMQMYRDGYEEFKLIRAFSPYTSVLANKLPKIERTQLDKNSFREKINNDVFEVKYSGDKFVIRMNDSTERSINVLQFPKTFVQNTLLQANARVLYDMALFGADFYLNEHLNAKSNIGASVMSGCYVYDDKTKTSRIELDPNVTIAKRMLMTIAHEVGHLCDMIEDKENAIVFLKEELKNNHMADMYRDKPLTLEELLQKRGIFQPSSGGDVDFIACFNEENQKFVAADVKINRNACYCTTSLQEFFAEAYALYTTGHCKSEYVICNYFPKTFMMFVEKLEQNRAEREKAF